MIVAINFNMLREQAKTTEVCAKKKLGSIKRSQLGMCTLGYINWRASVASETLTGVTQSKIGDVYLFIYLYICMDVCMSFCTLTLAFLC